MTQAGFVCYCPPMEKSLSDLSVAQLKRAILVKKKIETLEAELAAVLGGAQTKPVRGRRRSRSPNRRKSVAAPKPAPAAARRKAKRKVSVAARKRLSELAKARWKKVKAAGKSRL